MQLTGSPTYCARGHQRGNMKRFLQLLFRPHDGTRKEMLDTVVAARQDIERASSRLDYVVKRLIQENDRVTGKGPRNVTKPST